MGPWLPILLGLLPTSQNYKTPCYSLSCSPFCSQTGTHHSVTPGTSGSHLSPVGTPDGTLQPMALVTSEEYFPKELRKGVPLRWVWVGNRSPWKTVDWLVRVASGSLAGANNGAESKVFLLYYHCSSQGWWKLCFSSFIRVAISENSPQALTCILISKLVLLVMCSYVFLGANAPSAPTVCECTYQSAALPSRSHILIVG